jgi:hypothetical protein
MRQFKVDLQTMATATVTVTFEDVELAALEDDLREEFGDEYSDEILLAELRDKASERAFDDTPFICAQCSGYGSDTVSMDLGEWETPWKLAEGSHYVDEPQAGYVREAS